MTFFCKLADLNVSITVREAKTASYFKDYIIDPCEPDVALEVTDEMIAAETIDTRREPYYLEFLALYRALCNKIYTFDAFLLHAAVIEVDGFGYAFYAPSGTGKSTHIRLWREFLGRRCQIVNGDKPLIRQKDGIFYAYGTPWCGKERWQRNVRVPLRAICYLTRGETDVAAPLTTEEIAPTLLSQVYLPPHPLATLRVMENLDALLGKVSAYRIACTPNISAAKTAYEVIARK